MVYLYLSIFWQYANAFIFILFLQMLQITSEINYFRKNTIWLYVAYSYLLLSLCIYELNSLYINIGCPQKKNLKRKKEN